MLPDLEGCIDLLAAVGKQWVQDCRRQKYGAELAQIEFAHLAAWLDLKPQELQRLMTPVTPVEYVTSPAYGTCPVCGGPVQRRGKRGPQRTYCSKRCKQKRESMKKKGVERHGESWDRG